MILVEKENFKRPEIPSAAKNTRNRPRAGNSKPAAVNSPDSQRKRRFETDSSSEADSLHSQKRRARYDQACNN